MARKKMSRNHEVKTYTVKMADVVAFIANIDDNMAPFVDSVKQYADDIMGEVEQFTELRNADAILHAQTCLAFAIISPQCRFEKNVRATARLVANIYESFATSEAIVSMLTDNGADNFLSAKPLSKRLMQSMAFFRAIDDESMTLEALKMARKAGSVVGLGDKTFRMALALYDATLPIYTLDVHMLRGIQNTYGGTVAGSMSIQGKAYDALEAAMVAWHERNFPELPVFVSQWALWNAWGFGEHVSHLGIFGLEK